MKFSYILSAAALIACSSNYVVAVPVNDNSVALPSASISVTNSTTASSSSTTSQTAVTTLADAMFGTTATASITITRQNPTQSSANHFVGAASIAFPIAIISSVLLM